MQLETPVIKDPEEIERILRKTATSSLVQMICGLRSEGGGILAQSWINETPTRVHLFPRDEVVVQACEELNKRIPKTESW